MFNCSRLSKMGIEFYTKIELIHGLWPCLRPVHLDTIQHHNHTSVQGSRSVQSHLIKSREHCEHFPEKEWDKNYTFWLRSWSTPTSNLRAESDKTQVIYSIDWYVVFLTKCQIFRQLVQTALNSSTLLSWWPPGTSAQGVTILIVAMDVRLLAESLNLKKIGRGYRHICCSGKASKKKRFF